MRRDVRALAFVAVVALLGAVPAAARAATTWRVNTTADEAPPGCAAGRLSPCSIRQALAAASAGDTIVIPAAGAHYSVTLGPLTVREPVAIVGAGETATVIDAGGVSQVMSISATGTTRVSSLTITGGKLTSGGSPAGGGGIELATGSLSLTGVMVSGNSARAGQGGGGIFDHSAGTLSLADSAVENNTVSLSGGTGGGGILDVAGSLGIANSSITGNSVTLSGAASGSQGGGGIYDAGTSATITGSTIASNTATVSSTAGSNGGGGIYDTAGRSTYVNDTLVMNRATIHGQTSGDGGGALFHSGAPGSLSDLTIDQNATNASGGGIYDAAGAYTVKNTIVANNGGACAGPGGIVSAGFNLEGSNTCGFTASGDRRNSNPQLGPLTANGGPTATQALGPGSRAIDAGSCTDAAGNMVATDQRGLARPQPAGGKCDIGAFEFVPASPAPDLVSEARPAVLGSTRARGSAVVNPDGPVTTVQLQYGLDARYRPRGTSGNAYDHATRAVAIGPGYAPVTVARTISGLVPAALYHVRVVIVNAAGTVTGPDQTFVTRTDRRPPAPVLGRYINATPLHGLVRVLIGRTFVPLTETRRLRSGTEFDARQGTLRVSSARAGGGSQTATFGGAVFRISQIGSGRDRGLTIAALRDGAFPGIPSYAGCHKGATRILQTLRVVANGSFEVSGRYSAATGHLAQWSTADRCNGTQTAVRRGTVTVFNVPRDVTVLVRRGDGYLARPHPARRRRG